MLCCWFMKLPSLANFNFELHIFWKRINLCFQKIMLCDSVNFTSSVAVGFSFPLFSGAGWWILCLHEARDGCLCWGYFQLHDDNVRTSYAANLFSYFCNEPYNECIAVFCLLCSTVDQLFLLVSYQLGVDYVALLHSSHC